MPTRTRTHTLSLSLSLSLSLHSATHSAYPKLNSKSTLLKKWGDQMIPYFPTCTFLNMWDQKLVFSKDTHTHTHTPSTLSSAVLNRVFPALIINPAGADGRFTRQREETNWGGVRGLRKRTYSMETNFPTSQVRHESEIKFGKTFLKCIVSFWNKLLKNWRSKDWTVNSL